MLVDASKVIHVEADFGEPTVCAFEVGEGDGLFVPPGWLHAVETVGGGVGAAVNVFCEGGEVCLTNSHYSSRTSHAPLANQTPHDPHTSTVSCTTTHLTILCVLPLPLFIHRPLPESLHTRILPSPLYLFHIYCLRLPTSLCRPHQRPTTLATNTD